MHITTNKDKFKPTKVTLNYNIVAKTFELDPRPKR